MDTSFEYFKLVPDKIYQDIKKSNRQLVKAEMEGIEFFVFPHVYPSHNFRSSRFILNALKNLLKGKKVCDMGCGPGIVGLFSLHNGAQSVVQIDINYHAVKNAQENNLLHRFRGNKIKVFLSDCFDGVPQNSFDLIIFNIPYHCDLINIDDPLKYAFYDPHFSTTRKFLKQVKEYSHEKTQIFIAFSNKGNIRLLENLFDEYGYIWKLWKKINGNMKFDNRIYRLSYEKTKK